jgi:acyl-CoA-binding protein
MSEKSSLYPIFTSFETVSGPLYLLQHYIRLLSPFHFRFLRYVTKNTRLMNNLYLKFMPPPNIQCKHVNCQCVIQVDGSHPITHGYHFEIEMSRFFESVSAFAVDFTTQYDYIAGRPIKRHGDIEMIYFLTRLVPHAPQTSQCIRLIPPPMAKYKFPSDAPLVMPHFSVKQLIRNADYDYFTFRGLWNNLAISAAHKPMTELGIPSLIELCVRKLSIFNGVYGKVNGRSQVTSAAENLFVNHKYAKAVAQMSRQTDRVPPSTKEALALLPQALSYLYHHIGTTDKLNKYESKIDLTLLNSAYLGSSNGLQNSQDSQFLTATGTKVQVSASGKKAEMFVQDVKVVLDYLKYDTPFETYWDVKEKNEMFFSQTKQYDDDSYEAWKEKLRLFVIPSGPFIILEKLLCTLRHRVERGGCIFVGFTWTGGGAARLATQVGINQQNARKPVMVEGDFTKYDLSVKAVMIDIYVSFMLIYEKPGSFVYKMKKRALTLLLNKLIARITHLFAQLWGIVVGEVPSGCFDTSHMDSWITALYFCLFAVFQAMKAPPEVAEKIEKYLFEKLLAVYGDDHIYNKSDERDIATWLGGHEFAFFMKTHFDCEVRDVLDGVPFLSIVHNGVLLDKGVTFLQYQLVKNPYSDLPNQPWCVPFRETWAFLIRAVHGRTPRERDALDLALSCIGHAYGTYASNEDAYLRLYCIYKQCCLYLRKTDREVVQAVMDRLSHADFAELRRKGISKEDIETGFPSMSTLIKKNEIDPSRTSRYDPVDDVFGKDVFDW